MNPFKINDRVVCADDSFPEDQGHRGREKPLINEILYVAQVRGEYLRFNKYTRGGGDAWWRYDKFDHLDYLIICF